MDLQCISFLDCLRGLWFTLNRLKTRDIHVCF